MNLAFKQRHCAYCHRRVMKKNETIEENAVRTLDHVMPRSLGGKEVVIACQGCNNAKRNLPPEVFIRFIELYGVRYNWPYTHRRKLNQFAHDCMMAGLSRATTRHKKDPLT